ncbi:CDP-diacylglycerol--glycerol-3-phosphate 3-phosphatidyltransferase [Synoicihabitans lomoniglobus]|uniref:CDP-diacylglycerol--glycerol-3-phosphate 3-phosphatidyltransferase n=2 Tax=Synoicihabitans lomoniglobus TaxID=2909285 RepID=A0AAF0CR54_9BACT|nr:CDP-diacylglycerol--glycerol-3-phosphate 3-phosphatidyltransferase [Opitutaceae bacterium LMO-M01]
MPNILTVSRIPMLFVVVGMMEMTWSGAATWAFWLFILAALTDWLDGLWARKSGQVSTFGRFMDAVIDKVMVLGLMMALVNADFFGRFTLVALLLLLCILTRELAISGLRMVAASKNIVVEADKSGKVKTFTQLNAIGWLLGAKMFRDDFGHLFPTDEKLFLDAIHWVGLGLYVLAAILTVTSGASYFKRHAHVMAD